MPAAAMPHLAVDASIRVMQSDRWLVACPECNWYPEAYFVEEIAKQDAYRHNVDRHDGAGVEVIANMPIRIAEQGVRSLGRHERFHKRLTIGYALFLAFLAWGIYDAPLPFVAITVLWGVVLSLYARSWGMATQRHRHGQYELARLRSLFEPPPDSDEEGKQLA